MTASERANEPGMLVESERRDKDRAVRVCRADNCMFAYTYTAFLFSRMRLGVTVAASEVISAMKRPFSYMYSHMLKVFFV